MAMSVALECLQGDEFYCIQRFHACPQGEPFSWKRSRCFEVGESLRFESAYLDEHFKERPNGWMIVFKTGDGKQYAATQTYFVTGECWQGLQEHFGQQARKSSASKKAKVVAGRSSAKKKQPLVSGAKKRRIA